MTYGEFTINGTWDDGILWPPLGTSRAVMLDAGVWPFARLGIGWRATWVADLMGVESGSDEHGRTTTTFNLTPTSTVTRQRVLVVGNHRRPFGPVTLVEGGQDDVHG